MNYSTISVRYSKALYQLAKEKNIAERIFSDVSLMQRVISENKEFERIIESPVIPTKTKLTIVTEIFKSEVHELTFNFILLVFKNKRDDHLPSIIKNFIHRYKSDKGIKTIELTTVVPITDELKQQIHHLLKATFDVEPEFTEKINAQILGGFILRMDDKQIDSSISTQLKKFRKELIQ